MFVRRPVIALLVLLGLISGVIVAVSHRGNLPTVPPAHSASKSSAAPSRPSLTYVPTAIGSPVSEFGRPWVTSVQVVDLDQDGLSDVLYCEGQKNSVRWIRQAPRGVFTEQVIAENIPGPAHVWVEDVNGSGRRDVLVASMGTLLPTTGRIGAVIVLENLDNQTFRPHPILDQTPRVTDVRAANLTGHTDGRLDLIVTQFGYNQGETCWLENKGGWQFERHVVNTQSGGIHAPVADFDGDGKPDFAVLISQEWEEVHLLHNLGGGQFQDSVRWGSTNEDFGSSGMSTADLNRDGKPDLLFTNGDMFDYTSSGERAWHGIQWLENKGGDNFAFHRIGAFPGAFGPCAVDLNGDGQTDVVAVSAFADWSNPASVSLMAWINDGQQGFTPQVLARKPTHLITVAAGDLDGNGVPVLVTGGFHLLPPWDNMSNITLWRRQ